MWSTYRIESQFSTSDVLEDRLNKDVGTYQKFDRLLHKGCGYNSSIKVSERK